MSVQAQMISHFRKTYFSTPGLKFGLYYNCVLLFRSFTLDIITVGGLAKIWILCLELYILDLDLAYEIRESRVYPPTQCRSSLLSVRDSWCVSVGLPPPPLPPFSPSLSVLWYSSTGSPYKEPVVHNYIGKRSLLLSRHLPSGFEPDTCRGLRHLSDVAWLSTARIFSTTSLRW